MKKGLCCLFTGGMLFCGGAVPAIGAVELRLVVRVDNLAGFDATTVAGAERIVTSVFHRLGVQLAWQHPAGAPPVFAGLAAGASRPDFCINLVPVTATGMGGHEDVTGLAAVPLDGRMGSRIWVFRHRLETVIDNAAYRTPSRNPARLRTAMLAQVMAHEMGHLLLGSTEHSGAGIMTREMDLRVILLACTERLTFSPTESEKIRAAVRAINRVDSASADRAASDSRR
jgi:hypothetical protein